MLNVQDLKRTTVQQIDPFTELFMWHLCTAAKMIIKNPSDILELSGQYFFSRVLTTVCTIRWETVIDCSALHSRTFVVTVSTHTHAQLEHLNRTGGAGFVVLL